MKYHYLLLTAAILMTFSAKAQLVADVQVTDATCSGVCNGSAEVVISNGTPPYSFQWYTPYGETTQEIFAQCGGEYSVWVTDATDTLIIPFTIGYTDTVQVDINLTAADCSGGADGEVVTFVNGGTAPFVYIWSNGATTPVLTGLSTGPYVVWVTDANGCTGTQNVTVPGGNMEVAVETDGTDPCVGPLGLTAVVTGGVGNLSYLWSTQDTTPTISVSGESVVQLSVFDSVSCAASSLLYIPTVSGELGYYLGGWLNRGFCRYLSPLVVNNSCTTYNGPVTINLGSNLGLNSAIPIPDNITGSVATWDNVSIEPGEQFEPYLSACVPLSTACTDTVYVEITTNLGSETLSPPIQCSYDPNDKQVWPVGIGPEGYIDGTERLTYMVRFQNTGNAPATFIHIIDTLDNNLDLFSLNVLASSHDMELSIDEDHVLDFFFDNINLPDSTSDPAGSSGFVIYSIDMIPGLSPGTEIENTAGIYFDFNPPVITNTTLNTISLPVGIRDDATSQKTFNVYPNPVKGSNQFTVSFSDQGVEGILELRNLLGQTLFEQPVNGKVRLQIPAEWPSGTYILTLRTNNSISVERLSVVR